MSASDSSPLSSPPDTDDEVFAPDAPPTTPPVADAGTRDLPASKMAASPNRRKRTPSPPHEQTLGDNPDVAFIAMFRSRFTDVFPPKLPHFGPQDIERGVADALPSPQVESLLCALLGLVLNRKKYVERGHHGRALEEAIQTQKSQWPKSWNGANPISGGRSFNTMSAQERLSLLRTLIMWSLQSSDAVRDMIKENYKGSRSENDIHQPLSVQSWGVDRDRRHYYLIEGRDDTFFRLCRESDRTHKHITWRSVAGNIDELREVAEKLEKDGSQAARRLAKSINVAIPRFEATEEKRKRREYRQARKAQFTRPEPGFSLYEGRTRGKRMRYTFSDDDEEDGSDAVSVRRSARQSGRASPEQPGKPTVTASGRQVRSRVGGAYGESLLSGQRETSSPGAGEVQSENSEAQPVNGRPTRSSVARPAVNGLGKSGRHIDGYNSVDEMEEEDDAASTGDEWDGGDDDDEVDDQLEDDENDGGASSDEESDDDGKRKSLIVRLQYPEGYKPAAASGQLSNGIIAKRETSNPGAASDAPPPSQHLQNGHRSPIPLAAPVKPEDTATNNSAPQLKFPAAETKLSHAHPTTVSMSAGDHKAPPTVDTGEVIPLNDTSPFFEYSHTPGIIVSDPSVHPPP